MNSRWLLMAVALAGCRAAPLLVAASDAGSDVTECGCAPGWVCCESLTLCAQTVEQCPSSPASPIDLSPRQVTVSTGRRLQFEGCEGCQWSVVEGDGGTVDSAGWYRAPNRVGVFHVVASRGGLSAQAIVTVQELVMAPVAGQWGGASWAIVDGAGQNGRFSQPSSVVTDEHGNAYVIDRQTRGPTGGDRRGISTIRRISGPNFEVETMVHALTYSELEVEAPVDGRREQATFGVIQVMAADQHGHLFVGDQCVLRRIDLADWHVTTVSGSLAELGGTDYDTQYQCVLNAITGLSSDDGDRLFIARGSRHTIDEFTLSTGQTRRLVTGNAEQYITQVAYVPPFSTDWCSTCESLIWVQPAPGPHVGTVTLDIFGGMLSSLGTGTRWHQSASGYAGISASHKWGEATALTGSGRLISRLSGGTSEWNEIGTIASGFTLAHDGTAWAVDQGGFVRQLGVGVVAGKPTLGAGVQDGPGETATLTWNHRRNAALAPDGTLFVPDEKNHRIRKVNVATREVSTPWHDFAATAVATDGETLFASDTKTLRASPVTGGPWRTLATGFQSAFDLELDANANLLVLEATDTYETDESGNMVRQLGTQIVRVDAKTGLKEVVLIDETGELTNLASDHQGRLFATSRTGVEQIDLTTGLRTLLIASSPLVQTFGNLVVDGDRLYATHWSRTTLAGGLAEIDLERLTVRDLVADGATIAGPLSTARLNLGDPLAVTRSGDLLVAGDDALFVLR